MRLLPIALAAGALCATPAAEAQFANKSIGVHAGYLSLGAVGVKGGPVIALDGSLYVEHGFDLYARASFGFYVENVTQYLTLPISPAIGVRYLILEEAFQPFVGLNIVGTIWEIGPQVDVGPFFLAVSPNVGMSYYVNQDFSIGLLAEYQLIIGVSQPTVPLFHGLGIMGRVATHF